MSAPSIGKNQMIIWLNGQFIPWPKAQTHILDAHSLHYSGAVFEGIKAYNAKLFKAEQHIQRLLHSAKIFSLEIDYKAEDLIEVIHQLLDQNQLQNCYIRPLIWAGAETTKIGATIKPNICIAAWSPKISPSIIKNAIVSPWVKAPANSYAYSAKSSGNYSNILLSLRDAQQSGYDDALMLDWRGYIAEFSSSNIFVVKQGALYTPIADCFLDGITRQTVLEIANNMQLKLHEQHLNLDILDDADECFATGTACGIVTIDSITNDIKKYNFSKNQITSIIRNEYKKLTGQL